MIISYIYNGFPRIKDGIPFLEMQIGALGFLSPSSLSWIRFKGRRLLLFYVLEAPEILKIIDFYFF
jgi:hypothetical protein